LHLAVLNFTVIYALIKLSFGLAAGVAIILDLHGKNRSFLCAGNTYQNTYFYELNSALGRIYWNHSWEQVRRWKRKEVFKMRSINYAIKGAMLGAMALVLSTSPALAAAEHKVMDEKAKVEINKVEKVLPEAKKAEEQLVMKAKANSDAGVLRINPLVIRRINPFFDEEILGEGLIGEGLLGLEE